MKIQLNDNCCVEIDDLLSMVLSYENLYHIFTALRGPDFYGKYLKHLFTERIRYLAGIRSAMVRIRDTPQINYTVIRKSVNELKKWIKKDPDGCYHYLMHIRSALEELHFDSMISKEEYKLLDNLLCIYDYIVRFRSFPIKIVITKIETYKQICYSCLDEIVENEFIQGTIEIRKILRSEIKNAYRSAMRRINKWIGGDKIKW